MARPRIRLGALRLGFALVIGILWFRLAQVQLVDGQLYRNRAMQQRTERIDLRAKRGGISDRNGLALALTEERYHVGIAPGELKNLAKDVSVIAGRLGIPEAGLRKMMKRDWIYLHGPFSTASVEALRRIRGVHLEPEFVRYRPDRRLAEALLGRPASPGAPASGIERVLDTLLAGAHGSAVVLRDRKGRKYESPSRLDAFPKPGSDVLLTLDAELQGLVDRSLDVALSEFEAAAGDIVVVDPRTGEILAIASRTAAGKSTTDALTGVFEPGSTAKLFTAAALLEHDLVTESDTVWGERGEYHIGRRKITDHTPEGWMTLVRVVERSSNIGIAKFASRLDRVTQFNSLRSFGFGTPTGIEFPTESRGRLPRPAQWSGATRASLAMGYAFSVTPLQLAMAYAAIANDGVLLQPTLIRSIRSPDGKEVYRHKPVPVRRVVSTRVAALLREMLKGVVYHGGTGAPVALQVFQVAGKTGTARRVEGGGYRPGAYNASFASLFPADDPQIVMVVKLTDPRGAYAQLSAAPLTRSLLEQVLAAKTTAIDRARLVDPTELHPAGVPGATTERRITVAWPRERTSQDSSTIMVPDVIGLNVRAASRALHRAGLEVRVKGSGIVIRVDPGAGSEVRRGQTIVVVAERAR